MNEINYTDNECHAATYSTANSRFISQNEDSSSAERQREATSRRSLYEVHRFISLEYAKLLALLIVLGCACNQVIIRYQYGMYMHRDESREFRRS